MAEIKQRIKNKFNRFIDRYGWKGLFAVIFYPLITLVTTPVRLLQTLWNCRVLADGKWGDYNRFNPRNGLNSLFYWTQAVNISRYGRSGTSPILGTGNYFFGKMWHSSLISLYAYWRFAPIVPLLGMFGWLGGHLLWLDQPGVSNVWFLIVIFLTLISTTFYSNTFVMQNYNALGWLFMPIGLYGWASGNWVLATLAWVGASFGSFTVVFLACILSVVSSLQAWSIMPIVSVFPAGLKLLTHFFPFLSKGNIWESIQATAKGLGLTKQNAKYIRKDMHFNINRFYYLAIYGQFVVMFWILNNTIPVLMLSALGIWIINSRFARFADEQSMYMLVLSVAVATMMQTGSQGIVLLISFWILASPVPFLVGLPGKALTTVPKYKPFRVKPILQDMEDFLKPVSKGQRVLMAFDDLHEDYGKIFDGYRTLLEAPLYVAACKEIHFMPDWWGVFELNYEGAPDFWGREVEDVERQIKAWKADYVVIYQESGTELSEKWEAAGFRSLSHFSWAKYEKDFGDIRPYSGPIPDWWLLEKDQILSK